MKETNKGVKSKSKVEVVTTPKFRVSYPNVFKPQERENGPPQYNISMLFPKTKGAERWKDEPDLVKLYQVMRKAAKKKWGEVPKPCKLPFKDGDKKRNSDGELDPVYKGHWYAQAVSSTKPGIVHADGSTYIEAETDFYPGCFARATVNAFAWMNKFGKKGVSLGLRNLQKWSDGERLGGFTPADQEFEPLDDVGADEEHNYEDDDEEDDGF